MLSTQLKLNTNPVINAPQPINPQYSTVKILQKKPKNRAQTIPSLQTYSSESRPTTSGLSFTFGFGERTKIINKLECSSIYNLPCTTGEGPKVSMGRRILKKVKSEGPGPGAYTPEGTKTIPGFLFGSSKKFFNTKIVSPGPVYNTAKNFRAPCQSCFTLSKRPEWAAKESVPGPGSYDMKSTLNVSAITFKKRHWDKRPNSVNPGPGTYEHEPAIVEKGWSLGKASRKLDWTSEEKLAIKNELQEKALCKCMNPSLKYKKSFKRK